MEWSFCCDDDDDDDNNDDSDDDDDDDNDEDTTSHYRGSCHSQDSYCGCVADGLYYQQG